MKSLTKVALVVSGTLAIAASALAAFAPVKLDTVHSRIGFTASTLLFDVDGQFDKFDLKLDGDPAKLNDAKIMLSIDADSIDTDNEKRDEHLASADFLDVKKYPKITFVSENISQKGATVT